MNPTLDPVELAQGRALLSLLPDALANTLLSAHLEHQSGGHVACTFEVPGFGKCTTSADSPYEAIRLALVEFANVVATRDFNFLALKMNANPSSKVAGSESSASTERFQAKPRQQTIGVTLPVRLKEHFDSLADFEHTSFAEIMRRFAVFGFEDFVDRSLYASPTELLDLLANELHEWQDSSSEQVMLRLDPAYAIRIRSAAKEYKKSISEIAALSIAHGLVMQELLVSLEQKVSNVKGAATRQFLPKLELPPVAAPLISGVLAGSIRPPKALLKRLANVFDAPESLLSTLFRRSFDRRLVPSFKAEDGKPHLYKISKPWQQAVKSLNLDPEQEKTLLELGV